jgi:hypothetical protein
MTPLSQDPKETAAFELALTKLKAETEDSRIISEGLSASVSKLLSFSLNCDQEKGEVKKEAEAEEGYLTTLNELIYSIRFLNRRNSEILDHLKILL